MSTDKLDLSISTEVYPSLGLVVIHTAPSFPSLSEEDRGYVYSYISDSVYIVYPGYIVVRSDELPQFDLLSLKFALQSSIDLRNAVDSHVLSVRQVEETSTGEGEKSSFDSSVQELETVYGN